MDLEYLPGTHELSDVDTTGVPARGVAGPPVSISSTTHLPVTLWQTTPVIHSSSPPTPSRSARHAAWGTSGRKNSPLSPTCRFPLVPSESHGLAVKSPALRHVSTGRSELPIVMRSFESLRGYRGHSV
ncbi:hypothetical protein BO71DRAFT_202938 [Aspergillus ellipticus CBS 707.79]|uniref:Uncharacterized protein n=1 Tax=Aspergillus ellipticus CBS 707.79 TaxID=1448320 RepID=A0A319DE29_9EURO|nr:hypothetical protein BO71DRAFT_202938 [Aspergillus ellipticus CBS 707.79]